MLLQQEAGNLPYMNTVSSDPIQQLIINHSILRQIQVFLNEGNTIQHHSSYLASKRWILKSCCKVKSLAQSDWSKTYCLIHDPALTFIERSKTSELEMTVFQHASTVPTSELQGRTEEGGGVLGYPWPPLCEKLFFVPIMQVAKTHESEESARCLLLKDIVTDEQWD